MLASPVRGRRRPPHLVVAALAAASVLGPGEATRGAPKPGAKTEGSGETRGKLLDGVVNLNTAPPAVLLMLPGVGPGRVRGILDYRARRPFRTVDELVRIKGIGRRLVREIRPHLAVSGPSTARAGPPGLEGLNALAARSLAVASPAAVAPAKPASSLGKTPGGGPLVRPPGKGVPSKNGPGRGVARAVRARANHCPPPA